jgi:hypothetical protein
MISNCGHDENGKYTMGTAGDQTGEEWAVIPWYDRPWNVVLRHPDGQVRALIAQLAQECAENDHIGYDQDSSPKNDAGRYSFWSRLAGADYDPTKIKIDCETDCSGGVAAIVKAAGYLLGNTALQGVSIYCYTGNLRKALLAAGFTALTESKYLTSDEYLYAGDILLYEGHHTAVNLTNGSKCATYKVGWNKAKSNGQWWYSIDGTDKSYYANGVYLIDGKYYAFDADGWMVMHTGRFTTDDNGAINGIM